MGCSQSKLTINDSSDESQLDRMKSLQRINQNKLCHSLTLLPPNYCEDIACYSARVLVKRLWKNRGAIAETHLYPVCRSPENSGENVNENDEEGSDDFFETSNDATERGTTGNVNRRVILEVNGSSVRKEFMTVVQAEVVYKLALKIWPEMLVALETWHVPDKALDSVKRLCTLHLQLRIPSRRVTKCHVIPFELVTIKVVKRAFKTLGGKTLDKRCIKAWDEFFYGIALLINAGCKKQRVDASLLPVPVFVENSISLSSSIRFVSQSNDASCRNHLSRPTSKRRIGLKHPNVGFHSSSRQDLRPEDE